MKTLSISKLTEIATGKTGTKALDKFDNASDAQINSIAPGVGGHGNFSEPMAVLVGLYMIGFIDFEELKASWKANGWNVSHLRD